MAKGEMGRVTYFESLSGLFFSEGIIIDRSNPNEPLVCPCRTAFVDESNPDKQLKADSYSIECMYYSPVEQYKMEVKRVKFNVPKNLDSLAKERVREYDLTQYQFLVKRFSDTVNLRKSHHHTYYSTEDSNRLIILFNMKCSAVVVTNIPRPEREVYQTASTIYKHCRGAYQNVGPNAIYPFVIDTIYPLSTEQMRLLKVRKAPLMRYFVHSCRTLTPAG
ncbi:MAG: hypothetical protein K1X92_15765 [Bacteroidia bacterium]|nr:hypothetical protein [Bacteroidia bacterium]